MGWITDWLNKWYLFIGRCPMLRCFALSGLIRDKLNKALKGRNTLAQGITLGLKQKKLNKALKGRNILTQGKTLGSQSQMINKALKGRNSTPGLKEKILNNVKNNHHAAIIDPALYSSDIQY